MALPTIAVAVLHQLAEAGLMKPLPGPPELVRLGPLDLEPAAARPVRSN